MIEKCIDVSSMYNEVLKNNNILLNYMNEMLERGLKKGK